MFQFLRLVEQKSDDLGSGLSSAPAPSLAELQRTFDGIGFVFRRNLDHPQAGQIESAFIKTHAVARIRRHQAFAHANNRILPCARVLSWIKPLAIGYAASQDRPFP